MAALRAGEAGGRRAGAPAGLAAGGHAGADRGGGARRLALSSPRRRAGIYGECAWQLRRRQPPRSTRPTRSTRSRRPRSPPRPPRPPSRQGRQDAKAAAEAKTAAEGRPAKKSAKAEERSGAKAKATEAVPPVRRAQRQRAGDRRVAREGEDDQEVPRPRLRREGVGRPRQGSAQARRWASTSSTASSPSTWSSRARRRSSSEIKAAARGRGRVLLAPDPDREGEAIAWHIAEEIRDVNPNIQRVLFNEITKKAINEAIGKPMALDVKKFDSQQARRILDRLVGYEISPVLWTKVRRGLSAGRVQSVAVRLVVEREDGDRRVRAAGVLDGRGDRRGAAAAAVHGQGRPLDGKKAELVHEGQAREVGRRHARAPALRRRVGRAQGAAQEPAAAVHHLQAAAGGGEQAALLAEADDGRSRSASTKASRSARRAWSVSSPTCVPTRRASPTTRSPRCARYIARAVRRRRSCPREPIVYKTKKSAQDAHEAIRPDVAQVRSGDGARRCGRRQGRRSRRARDRRSAQALHADLEPLRRLPDGAGGLRPDRRSTSRRAAPSCARPARSMKFPGFLSVYAETRRGRGQRGRDRRVAARRQGGRGGQAARDQARAALHPAAAAVLRGDAGQGAGGEGHRPAVDVRGDPVDHPGPRLRREEGGAPSPDRARRDGQRPAREELPRDRQHRLHRADGGAARSGRGRRRPTGSSCSTAFYTPFKIDLEKAKIEMRDVKREEKPTDEVCEKCGKPMVIKWGRNGHFLACSGYPECRNTKEFTRNADGSLTVVPTTRPSDEICPTCGSPMVIKRGRFGEFLACSRYPDCKTTSPHLAGRRLPEAGLRRLPDREALAARQGVLRLLELLEDQVRLRVVGSPAAAAVPEVRRQVRRAEGEQGGRAHPLHQRRLRLHRRPRGERARARGEGARRPRRPDPRPPRSAATTRRTGLGRGRPHQRRDRLDVPGLREHVERLHAQAGVARPRPAWRCRAPASRGCTTRRRSCAARRPRAGARNASPQPLRGGSTMTAASAPANGTPRTRRSRRRR